VLVNEVKTVDKDMNCDAVLNKLTAFLWLWIYFFLPTIVVVAT
jgi:hypothetical protein